MSRFGPEFERRFRELIDAAEVELADGDTDLVDRVAARLGLPTEQVATLIADASAALEEAGVEMPVATSPLHALVHLASNDESGPDDEAAPVYTTGPRSDPDRYAVTEAIPVNDGGGQGVVFRATTRRFGRDVEVALKQLHTVAPTDVAWLARRMSPMSGFDHPHLARHLEVFAGRPLGAEPDTNEAMDVVYVASGWVHGSLLVDVVENRSPATRLGWVVEVGRAAAALHGLVTDESPEGLIHRDIKPGNIIVTPDDRAVLIDYGLVRPISEEQTDTKAFTLRWMAPETIEDPDAASPQSDAWAVGQLAHWMIVKREISRRQRPEQWRATLLEAATSEGIPRPNQIAEHIVDMLADEPADRPDLAGWCDKLEQLLGTDGDRRPRSRRRLAAVGLVAGAVLSTSIGYLALVRDADNADGEAGDRPPASEPATITLLQGTNGAPTYRDPVAVTGSGERIPPSTEVEIDCKVHAPQIPTANPAGYWYRVASPPWNGRYYAVANTFFNADDIPGRKPYLYDTDPSVPDCDDFDWGDLSLSDVVDLVDEACVERQATLADVRQKLAVFANRQAARQERIDAGTSAGEQMIRNSIVGALPRPANEEDRRLIDQFAADYYAAAYWFDVGVDELDAGGSTGTADASIDAGMVSITNAVDSIVRLGADNCDNPD